MTLTLGQITAEVREVVIGKGFRPAEGGPGENTWGDYIALLHSEVSEALEAYRDHRLADATKYGSCVFGSCDNHPHKPEGVGSEFADVLIRLVDMADVFGVPLAQELRLSEIESTARAAAPGLWSFGDSMAWLHETIAEYGAGQRLESISVLIALVTVADMYGIDIEAEYVRKMAYNRTRVWQHGGRTLAGEKEIKDA